MIEITILGEPRSKARPRFAGGHAYSATRQREHEELLRQHLRPHFPRPLPGNVAVTVVFYRSTKHRVDLDNLLKCALDAANGVCWVDDQQVTELSGRLELDREAPRTIVRIIETSSTMQRGADEVLVCIGCGKDYTPREGVAKGYHSVECSRRSRELGVCAICKTPLSRRGALLCKPCWLSRVEKNRSKKELQGADVRQRGRRPASSRRRGVSLRKESGKWAAYVQWDGRRLTLGTFATEEAAIAAVDQFEGEA